MIKLYFKIAIRNLLKYRAQNIISVVGLAVGIFCFTVCMYMVRFIVDADRFYDNDGRIAVLGLYTVDDEGSKEYEFNGATHVGLGEELRGKDINGVEAVAAVWTADNVYKYKVSFDSGKEWIYRLRALEVDAFYKKVFTPTIVAGSWEAASKVQNSLVMSRTTAENLYGSVEEAMGKRIVLVGKKKSSPGGGSAGRSSSGSASGMSSGREVSYTVGAVMEDLPLNNSYCFLQHVDMLVMNDSEGCFNNPWYWKHATYTVDNYLLIKESSSVEEVNEELARLYKTYKSRYSGANCKLDCRIFPVDGVIMEDLTVPLISGVGILILLVAFINMFYLLVGSFFNRTKEYSLMKLLGSNKKRIFMLLFIECILMVLCSAFILFWFIEIFGNKLSFSIDVEEIIFNFDKALMYLQAFEYIALTVLLCAVLSGVVTIYISRISVCSGIYGGERRVGKHIWRNVSMGVQFVICWIFIILAISCSLQSRKVITSVYNTLSMKQKREILNVPLNYDNLNRHERAMLMEKIRGIAGVKDIMQNWNGLVAWLETPGFPENSRVSVVAVPRNFFEFMNIPLEQGRALENENDVVLDRIYFDGRIYDKNSDNGIYGVKGRYYNQCGTCAAFYSNVYDGNFGTAYILQTPDAPVSKCLVKCEPGMMEDVKAEIEKLLKEFMPSNETPHINLLTEEIVRTQPLESALSGITFFFALIAIAITLLGVYSSITIDTARRQKEVAIRKVYGAGLPQIMLLFGRLYISLLGVTALVSLPMLYAVIHYFEGQYTVFFNYGFLFWLCIFVGVSLLVLFTIIFKILQVASQNPAEVLKRE